MNRKQLEECAWKKTPKDERRAEVERYDWKTKTSTKRRLTGNAREVLVFDPSGSTPGSMSPFVPLWSLYSDELEQRCREEQMPKLRAPYNRMRSDYTGDVESSPGTQATREGRVPRHHATKKSPAQLDREIAEALAGGGASSAFEQAKAEGAALESELSAAEQELKVFPRGPMGLTPDAVKALPEYRAAKARVDKAFARLRAFNGVFVKRFAKELRAERAARTLARERGGR
ncbi:MAG: hypothetical protein ACM37U_12605 [Gemmatimonas sp.]